MSGPDPGRRSDGRHSDGRHVAGGRHSDGRHVAGGRMSDGRHESEREVYVLFRSIDPAHAATSDRLTRAVTWVISRWFKPGFQHISLLVPDGCHWLYLDPHLNGLEIRGHGFEPPQVLSTAILRCTVRDSVNWRPRGPLTCLAVAKYVLGSRSWALTPWQFHQHLIKQGAVDLWACSHRDPRAPDGKHLQEAES